MGLRIAYVNYGFQSGVTGQVTKALEARGHQVISVNAVGPLEHRDPGSRSLRLSPAVVANLAMATAKFGRLAPHHRWNTAFAFDIHSAHAGAQLEAMDPQPDVILQAGALFSPGKRPSRRYVLLLDNTRQLAMERPADPSVGLDAPPDYGSGWRERETRTYRGASAIAAFSRRVCDSLEGHYGVAPGRAHVVGAGANVFPERVERRDDGETILFIGTRWELKGGPVLARAFSRLRRRRPKARLLVVGPGTKPDLPEGASYLGYLPAAMLPGILAQASVFALPTIREAFGIAYLDAMACGVPCVGTAVEAVPEIVEHGTTGLLVPPSDDAALEAALEKLLTDRELARRMGEAGRERVATRFLWSHVGERLEALLLPDRSPRSISGSRAAAS